MYKIIVDGQAVAMTDKPQFVRFVNGVSQKCNYEEAEGVIAGGRGYNLNNHNAYPDAPTAWVHKCDGWEIVFQDDGRITLNEINTAELQDAACDMDADIEDIKDALCELDELINGGE